MANLEVSLSSFTLKILLQAHMMFFLNNLLIKKLANNNTSFTIPTKESIRIVPRLDSNKYIILLNMHYLNISEDINH